jgi:hypothetical protein
MILRVDPPRDSPRRDSAPPALEAARCAAQVMVWTASEPAERALAEAVLDALRELEELIRSARFPG